MTHRFFVDEEIPEQPVLRGDQAHQIANVLRLRPGELITLARNGVEAIVELQTVEGNETRGRVPKIEETHEWEKLFDVLHEGALIAWEGEALRRFQDVLARTDVSIVIGPEGGIRPDEIEFARERGAITVSLGPRNLRSETAAISSIARAVAALDR